MRCKHGVNVGGCGADLMCYYCENDIEPGRFRAVLVKVQFGEYDVVLPGQWEQTPAAALALIDTDLIDALAAQGSHIAVETR